MVWISTPFSRLTKILLLDKSFLGGRKSESNLKSFHFEVQKPLSMDPSTLHSDIWLIWPSMMPQFCKFVGKSQLLHRSVKSLIFTEVFR